MVNRHWRGQSDIGCTDWIRTNDLDLMRVPSYQAALLRDYADDFDAEGAARQ